MSWPTLGMRCASCQRDIATRYTYSLICDSDMETWLAVFCSICWENLLDGRTYKQVRQFMSRIPSETPRADQEYAF